METSDEPTELGKKVLELIQKGQSKPEKLVEIMLNDGITEDAARTVMSDLIDRNAIIFTKDWRVKVNPLASAAA